MFNQILKYKLEITDQQVIDIPKESKILTVQIQNNTIFLWALVDRDSKAEKGRLIAIYGTGQPLIAEGREYIGTVQLDGLVWHIFEIKK